ncbi:ATP-binding protein [Cryobacterium glaciale]|uniref:ATP-binding protein n=1 Tax=Cryobacterium glaciale TaxID=1259145 RepID=A0A4V3I8Z9_9MICO|nr:ATP-binding protein [Cryobacterium glaciale]TFB77247.1 ATP-binding protein [Cryobacterium glaciale]
MTDSSVIDAIAAAVAVAPTNSGLRVHLIGLLLDAARKAEARTLLQGLRELEPGHPLLNELDTRAAAEKPGFDWTDAEAQVRDIARPPFVASTPEPVEQPEPIPVAGEPDVLDFESERPAVTLADVGGLVEVKKRLNASFLAPLKNPELTRMYHKSLRGGLLLYGPPGCGKTFLAKAIAGELGASFISVSSSDIFQPFIGETEKALHSVFEKARNEGPCVLFLDEVDGIGGKRSAMGHAPWLRLIINQLLTELDGVNGDNEGVYVLAATNQPWDVDPALRRPGRLDRTLLVLPPDHPAREAIFAVHLRDRPVEAIDLGILAARSDGLSGADIAYVCELAAEIAMMDSIDTGVARMIGMDDLLEPLRTIAPSIIPWLESARTVVSYGTDDGTFGELKAYLKKVKRW